MHLRSDSALENSVVVSSYPNLPFVFYKKNLKLCALVSNNSDRKPKPIQSRCTHKRLKVDALLGINTHS